MDQTNSPLASQKRDRVIAEWLKFEEAFRKAGVPFKPASNKPPGEYLPDELINQALYHLKLFGEFIKMHHPFEIWDDREFAEVYLQQIRVKIPREFMNTVERDDLVEMYDLNNIQIFRNMNFMKVCGYSLADIAVHPWPVLFERSQVVTSTIQTQIGSSITGGHLAKLDVEPHLMKERFSSTRQVVEVRLGYCAPVYDIADVLTGFAVSCKAKIIEEIPKRHELRFI